MRNDGATHAKHRERMVEKFLKNPEVFADHELLEILLYSVIKRQDTNAAAHRILSYFKNLKDVFEADINTLMKIEGVGPRVATEIKTVGLLMNRCMANNKKNYPSATSYMQIKPYLYDFFKNTSSEKFLIMLFNEKGVFLSQQEFTSNDFDKVLIDTSRIIETISIVKASQAIIAHNHPSGDVSPSTADDHTTTKINMILNLHKISLLDHIIVSDKGFFSYFKEGRLQHLQDSVDIDTLIKKTITENK